MRLLAYCEGNHHSIIEYLSKRIDFVQGFALLLLCMHMWFLLFTRNSLVRANSEVYVLLYVCLFVLFCLFVRFLSTITRPAAARFTPNFACGRTLVPDVPSPLLGVSAPHRAEKGENEIFVTIGVKGESLHFGGFWAISTTIVVSL